MQKTRVLTIAMLGVVATAQGVCQGQEAPAAASAAELLAQLRAAGVEIPEGFVANEDGTVSVPAAPAEVNVADGAAAAAEAGGEAAESAVPGSDLPEINRPAWDTRLNIGLNWSDGNTERLGLAATIATTRETDRSRLSLDAGYFYGQENGDDTENRFTAGALHDWLMPESRWLYFADFRYDYDDFASYMHRVAGHVGVGYEAIKKDTMNLTLRAGVGASREFGSDNDSINPEALLGFDFSWDIAENQSLEVVHRTYPSLKNSGEFRTLTTAGWNLAISQDDGLSFTVTALHEYLSEVDAGSENYDLKVFAGIAYDF